MAMIMARGMARPTYWLLLNNLPKPREGSTALGLVVFSTRVYGLVSSFTLVSSIFVR